MKKPLMRVKTRTEQYFDDIVLVFFVGELPGLCPSSLVPAPTQEVMEIWDRAESKQSPAEWALQWVWNHPEVSLALSGMSEMKHVEENVMYADRSGPGTLSDDELVLYSEVKDSYNRLGFVGCTACQYCMPCPERVAIPTILGYYNEHHLSGGRVDVKTKYWENVSPVNHASVCIACGKCEEKCTQELPIRKFMSEATRIFPSTQE